MPAVKRRSRKARGQVRIPDDGRLTRARSAETVLALLAAHMPYLLTRDLDDVFAAIVRHLLAGLAADLAERAAPARRRGHA